VTDGGNLVPRSAPQLLDALPPLVNQTPVGFSTLILAPHAKAVKQFLHNLPKSFKPSHRTVTIAYRESSPRQTQRRLCGVTIQTSCFDSGTSPTRSVGVSEVYIYRHIRQMGECPSMRFPLSRSISIGTGNRSIFAPRKPMQNVHMCAFRFRVQSLLVSEFVQFWGESRANP